jgi:hydroxymethylglutaryl-CoA lyase
MKLELPKKVSIGDITVRDGFQNLNIFIPTETKLYIIEELQKIGFKDIEVTSLSNPKHLRQFADAEEVLKSIKRRPDVKYQVVTMNERAIERAIDAKQKGYGPDKVIVMMSTSQSHNLVNAGELHKDHWAKMGKWVKMTKASGILFCGCLGTIFGCPIEGPVPLERAWEFADRYADLDVDEMLYGDTTGEGTPDKSFEFYSRLIEKYPNPDFHVVHFHESRGWALSNNFAALQAGMTRFEASMGGLGGQPASVVDRIVVSGTGESYTPSALTGNSRAEDLLVMFDEMGIKTDIDVDAYIRLGKLLEQVIGRRLRSWTTETGRIPKKPTDYLEKVRVRFAEKLKNL